MGIYLNCTTAYTLYKNERVEPYFVDKTIMLEEIFPMVTSGNKHICITRPRRFGKTIMANMIAAFFSKVNDASDIFETLAISKVEEYRKHLNKYNVIHISFNELPARCKTYDQYIERIENILQNDLQENFPDVKMNKGEAVWDILKRIYVADSSVRFIFVLDEWDYIFHRSFVTEYDKQEYISFLSNLLKDKPYVLMTYMTGILPIAKYSSGSELNMFLEYTMVSEEKYSEYFGFTEAEVDKLYEKYLQRCQNPNVTREGLRIWYNGYHTAAGERVYNPRSVVASLVNNNLGKYDAFYSGVCPQYGDSSVKL